MRIVIREIADGKVLNIIDQDFTPKGRIAKASFWYMGGKCARCGDVD